MRIMLVDDNYQMLEYLDQSISWSKEGMTLVAKCENGERALAIAKSSPIDILVTDIDMPKMNGIDLIKQLQQIYPKMKSIIISSYDEFKYAQQAVKLLVSDYILKDKLDSSSLLKTLHQIMLELKKEQDNQLRLVEWESLIKENQLSIKRQWLRNLVDTPIKKQSELKNQLLGYGINFDESRYISIIGKVTNEKKAIKRFESADLLMNAIEQLSTEFFSHEVEGFVYNQLEMIWFQPVKRNVSEMMDKIQEFQKALKEYFNIEFAFVHYPSCDNEGAFLESIKKLLKMENEWFFITGQEIVDYHSINSTFIIENAYDLYESTINDLKGFIMKEEKDLADKYMDEWFERLMDRNFHPNVIKGMSHKIIIDLYINFHFMNNQTNNHAESIHFDISSAQSLQQLKKYYKHYIDKIIKSVLYYRKSYRSEIWEALIYVDENIDKKITLNDISQTLYINPTYFSRIFKKDTGQSFVDYVKNRKMEKAQKLLEETDYTIESISFQLGFSNSSYFIKQFRQCVGKTPMEYRKVNE
ncbi:response regulator transcription factor [Aquibacillus albus]|uniref:Two-component system response regulator YesN n=1 Tax=Aquibacillus albus TaxID=1168171 RepID=A0ABS2MZD2_9BACI|nr:response regulator [Aquibacillus albus]MBM7571265.1 two-component system response regulator YesN [Aquibacillus albus]